MASPIHERLKGTTQALFWEYRFVTTTNLPAPYNLKEYDWKGSKSMYQIYMACDTEYDAAITLLGSWPHWQKLCRCGWFQSYIEDWREERKLREQAIAKKALIKKAKEGDVSASRALLQDEKKPKGRPKNKETVKPKDNVDEIYKRFKSIEGGKK